MRDGWVLFRPVLLDSAEIPEGGALRFTRNGVAYTYRRGAATRLRVRREGAWEDCPLARFEARGVQEVLAEISF
jgi:hypothetical protein